MVRFFCSLAARWFWTPPQQSSSISWEVKGTSPQLNFIPGPAGDFVALQGGTLSFLHSRSEQIAGIAIVWLLMLAASLHGANLETPGKQPTKPTEWHGGFTIPIHSKKPYPTLGPKRNHLSIVSLFYILQKLGPAKVPGENLLRVSPGVDVNGTVLGCTFPNQITGVPPSGKVFFFFFRVYIGDYTNYPVRWGL